MKLMKKTGLYKASNLTFNPKTCNAYSYGWWRFVARVNGKVIFNNYRYSNTTARHQYKVRRLLEQLGIKIDIEAPYPKGIPSDQDAERMHLLSEDEALAQLIVEGEEGLCLQFLNEEVKRDERNARARAKRLKAKLEDYLENTLHFRDYDITDAKYFGHPGYTISTKVAVHQCVDADSLERDVENAIHNFQRDGFGSIVFYIEGAQ